MSAAPDLAGFGTAVISDALDMLGVNGGLEGLLHLAGPVPVAGPAFTVRYETVEVGAAARAGDYVDEVPPGSVIVIANDGRTHCTVWGDILSQVALARGVRGTVVDGVCRDIGGTRDAGYGMWARGAYMKSGKNRVRLAALQSQVVVCGVRVEPGDVVCADASGVIVVPAAQVPRVAELAREIEAMEARVLASVAEGRALSEAREIHGYHQYAFRVTPGSRQEQAHGSS